MEAIVDQNVPSTIRSMVNGDSQAALCVSGAHTAYAMAFTVSPAVRAETTFSRHFSPDGRKPLSESSTISLVLSDPIA